MVDIVRLEDADTVAQPKGAKKDAPRPSQHDPSFPAALGEPIRVHIDLLRSGYMLFDRRRLDVGLRVRGMARFRLHVPAAAGVGVCFRLLHFARTEKGSNYSRIIRGSLRC